MEALFFEGGQLRYEDNYPEPVPGPGEALVRVSFAGICATDLEIVKGYMDFSGVPGHEFTGVVEAGSDELVGRRVVGEINIGCGDCDYDRAGLERHCPQRSVLGILAKQGAFAEYLTLQETNLHVLPDQISDEEAVFVEPLAAACEIMEQVEIGSSDRVCVLGDGRLGLLVAQVLARAAGSLLVIGRHSEKLSVLEKLGIETAMASTSRAGEFDFVVDCTGDAAGLEQAAVLVRPRGTIVLKTTIAGERRFDFNQLVIDEITLLGSRCGPFPPALAALAGGRVQVMPLIDRVFPLAEGIEAFEHAALAGVTKVLLRC